MVGRRHHNCHLSRQHRHLFPSLSLGLLRQIPIPNLATLYPRICPPLSQEYQA
ncbi:hypothetical protein BDZ45DRAFT_766622 [Acephala macrosclerotiorum]|nr:hypothetical protein BDZ45DRAFT_766622 [Acephala macrosclerotiorum]